MPRPRLARLELDEDPDAWAALGFAGPVAGTELVLRGGGGGIAGWALAGVPAGDLDGLPTARADGAGRRAVTHRNGAVAVDHVVVRTPDVGRTVAALEAAGLQLRRTREVGEDAVQAFLPLADALVEVVGPRRPSGEGPARFWGVVFAVADLDAAAALLGDRLGPPRPAVQPGRRIATVDAAAAGIRTPLALMSAR